LGTSALVASATASCSAGDAPREANPGAEPVASVQAPVLGGRPSPDSENSSVFLLNETPERALRCSGSLVGPNIVATARHCVLKERSSTLKCTPTGELADPSDPRGQDTRTAEPSAISVGYGTSRSTARMIRARRVVTPAQLGLCRADIAFVITEDVVADRYAALRLAPVTWGERLRVSGWGYRSDGTNEVPDGRFTLENLRVEEIGPGGIPADTFAIVGNTVCFGDSGAGAFFADAVGGVYSRIEGPACALAGTRNVFTAFGPYRSLVDEAFAAAGAKPWIAGEPAPWLARDGERCTVDADCAGGACDVGAGVCRARACDTCTDAGPDASPVASPRKQTTCAAAPLGSAGAPPDLAGALFVALAALARRRRPSRR